MKKTFIAAFLFMLLFPFLVNAQTKKTDRQMFDEAYVLPKDSVKLADMTYSREIGTQPILYSIERLKDATRVTFIAPIYFDSQWLHFGKGFKIVDRASGDEYAVRGYADGTPFGRLLVVKGFNKKCIFVTLLFPKLKKNVKRVDILELPHPDDLIPSNNDGILRTYFKVKVKDYLVSSRKDREGYE